MLYVYLIKFDIKKRQYVYEITGLSLRNDGRGLDNTFMTKMTSFDLIRYYHDSFLLNQKIRVPISIYRRKDPTL